MALPRQEELLKLLDEVGNISVKELSSRLKVSEQTIRRDLRKLEAMQLLSRYHGGVVKMPQPHVSRQPGSEPDAGAAGQVPMVNLTLEEREQSFVEEKQRIAKAAAQLIPDGSTVFITIGTTVEHIAHALIGKQSLRIITDSLRVAAILYPHKGLEVMVPSGTLRRSNGGIEGPDTIADLANFRADFLLTSIGAIDQDGTLLDFNLSEVKAVQMMMKNARRTAIICDHSKFTAAAPVCLGSVTDADFLITDAQPPQKMQSLLSSGKTQLIVV